MWRGSVANTSDDMMLTADPAERPPVYTTTLSDFLAYRARIINASEMYNHAPDVVKDRLVTHANTLRRVLDGTAQMKRRDRLTSSALTGASA